MRTNSTKLIGLSITEVSQSATRDDSPLIDDPEGTQRDTDNANANNTEATISTAA